MNREVRNTTHQKQNRIQIQRGVPNVAELSEAVAVLRSVPGIGIVEYIRYNGQLYASAYSSTSEPISANTTDNISLLNGSGFTGGAQADWTGTDTNVIGSKWEDTTDDLASLAAKINKIIRILRKAHIIGYDGRFGDTLGA